jgi:hypothetical protein
MEDLYQRAEQLLFSSRRWRRTTEPPVAVPSLGLERGRFGAVLVGGDFAFAADASSGRSCSKILMRFKVQNRPVEGSCFGCKYPRSNSWPRQGCRCGAELCQAESQVRSGLLGAKSVIQICFLRKGQELIMTDSISEVPQKAQGNVG